MLAAPGVPVLWRTARGAVALDRPLVVGILNVTPDSFWDGGRHQTVEAALRRAGELLEAGAAILDIGGESTRPGAAAVDAAAETRRVVPVVQAILRRWPEAVLSVDTVKADVARATLDAGAAIINDVSALRLEPDLASVAASAGAGLILMHSRGTVETMARYDLAEYSGDVAGDVASELAAAARLAGDAGVPESAIVLDPGLGFAKTTSHSLTLLRELHRLVELGYPVLVGPSRKRFIGEAAGGLPADQRLAGSIAACVIAWQAGARLFRVHDAAETVHALAFAAALSTAAQPEGEG